MAEFFTSDKLSGAIKQVLAGDGLRCAVAFWGSGATELLRSCSAHYRRARIVCDVTLGGTNPSELKRLGAPNNQQLRHFEGLHAKVYISSNGAVVTSANCSDNGIGFSNRQPRLTEVGTFHEPEDPLWRAASDWFDKLYSQAQQVDDGAVEIAKRRFLRRPDLARKPPEVPQGSLLRLVQAHSHAFKDIGFVFPSGRSAREDIEEAKAAAINQNPSRAKEIKPLKEAFTNWDAADVRQWPRIFVQFWMPRGRLYIYSHEALSWLDRAVVPKALNWTKLQTYVGDSVIALPSKRQVESSDAMLTKRLLEKQDYYLFANGDELAGALDTLDSEASMPLNSASSIVRR